MAKVDRERIARDPVLDATPDRTFDGTLDGPRQTDRARVDTTYGKKTDTRGGGTLVALVSRPDT